MNAAAIQLETRSCLCGCGATMRVMTTSPQLFNSVYCQEDAEKRGIYKRPAVAAVKTPSLRIRPAPTRVEPATYSVSAEIARATPIPQEPPMPKPTEGLSLADVARELGVPYSTLYAQFKVGRLKALPGDGRPKFDLAAVREAQGSALAPVKKRAPRAVNGKEARVPVSQLPKSSPPSVAPAADWFHFAVQNAFQIFCLGVKQEIEAAREAADEGRELSVYRLADRVSLKKFRAALEAL